MSDEIGFVSESPSPTTWPSAGTAPELFPLKDARRRFHLDSMDDAFKEDSSGFLTMEAIVDVAQKGQFNRTGRLQNVVLASPDIDIDLFRSQMKEIDTDFDRFFVLLSKDDSALLASRRIAGGVPRVGAADAEELSKLGVTAIDLSKVDDSRTGSHSKFSGSPEVVQLIGQGLNNAPAYGSRRQTVLEQVIGDLPVRVVTANN